jgi:hypothetical protein
LAGRWLFSMGLIEDEATTGLILSPEKVGLDEAKANGCHKDYLSIHARLL